MMEIERRSQRRRQEDYEKNRDFSFDPPDEKIEMKADNLRFSVKDLSYLISGAILIGSLIISYNSRLEDMMTRHVVLESRVTNVEKTLDTIGPKIDSLQQSVNKLYTEFVARH